MYKALILITRPHIDYCDIIYHLPSKIHLPPLGKTLNSLMEKAVRIQYQTALAITGVWQGSSRSKIYEESGWESLSDRRNCRRVLQIYKIINKNTLSYLKEKLPPKVRTTFHAIVCISNRYMNSFFPYASASWNLVMEIFKYKEVPFIGVLKNDIISLIRPMSKSVFKIHDPVGTRYLFELRLSLSPLKGHKWWYISSGTPSGICHCDHAIEDTSHFLFTCPSHAIQRAALVTVVNDILHKFSLNHLVNHPYLYVYGDPSVNNSDNKTILFSTIKYIKETRRFST